MAINAVLVGARGTSATNTVTTTAGTTQAANSTFVICTSFDPGVTDNTPTDSKSNTYTRIGTVQTGNAKITMYRCENGTGGASHTATHTFSGSAFPVCHLIEVTGALAASFDQTAQGNDASGSPYTLTSPTLSQADEVVIALCESNGSGGANGDYASSNFTILSSEQDFGNFWTSGVAKLVVSATTAVTPSFTRANDNSAATCGLILATFKAGTAAPAASLGDQPNRPRPGRGPFSKGRFYLSDTTAYTSVASGAIAGTAGLSFGQTGALTGAGALAGTSALVFAQTGALLGSGALAGSTTLTFAQTGALTGAGALAGTSALVFGQTGALTGAGALSGTSALVFGQTGTLTQPTMTGAAALVFGQTGTLTGAGVLAGASALTFGQSATLTAAGILAGASALTFAQTAALAGSGALAGSSALVFGASATADLPPGALVGTASLSFSCSGTLTAFGALIGNCQILFDGSATSVQGAMPGALDSPRMAEGAYRRKRRKLRKQVEPEHPVFIPPNFEIAPPQAVIDRARTFEALAQTTNTPPTVLRANVEHEITEWLRVEQDADDEQALMMILKALDD